MLYYNLNDVLSCKRVMDYKGISIEYTTDLDGVKVDPYAILAIMQNVHREFGHLKSIDDLAYVLTKHGCLPRSLSVYDNTIIADYIHEHKISIDVFIRLCDKFKSNTFKGFLMGAKDVINKYGIYVPDPKMKHYNRRNNNERNLADTLDLQAVADGAYKLGLYTDNAYIAIADTITSIVFNMDLETLRCSLNMLYDDFVSDCISDYDFDMVAYCCKVMSYLLKYSDLGLEGLEVFTKAALEIAASEYDGSKYQTNFNGSTGDMIGELFDTFTTNDLEYNSKQKIYKKPQVSKSEVDDLKKYL
jgi:hypothetical protein